MIDPKNPILSRMLERLFVTLMDGPSMNCKPHASRQRVDLAQIEKLQDLSGGQVLLSLLREGSAKLTARVPLPSRISHNAETPKAQKAEEKAAHHAWSEQYMLRNKLKLIAEDARTYEQDTGVHSLHIGFPLISLPPGIFGGRVGTGSRRVLAPIAFIPTTLVVKTGAKQAVDLALREQIAEGELLIPNIALMAWLEQQSGRALPPAAETKDEDLWRQLCELTRRVAAVVEVSVPAELDDDMPAELTLQPTPKSDDGLPLIVAAAVLGLFPSSNEGLLRDTREILAQGVADGPIANFIRLRSPLTPAASKTDATDTSAAVTEACKRVFAEERMIADADPCQARAVRLAQLSRALVVHGPPGTGKSQTITNVIGDHLARGQRVLFVSDRRTALDVVADRLNVQGLGELCATVHDPAHDQRELYRAVREQLDGLVDAQLKPKTAEILARIDAEMQTLHDEMLRYHRILIGQNGGPGSFHYLVGQWMAELANATATVDESALRELPAGELDRHNTRLKEVLERGEAAGYASNPWRKAAGVKLGDFLSTSMESYRTAIAKCVAAAEEADATRDPNAPTYSADADLAGEAEGRARLAGQLKDVLARIKPADAAVWASHPLAQMQAVREKVAAVQQWVEVLRARRLDPALLAHAPQRASADQLRQQAETLGRYLQDFAALAGDFTRVRAKAVDADDATIARWIRAGSQTAATAARKLSGASALVKSIELGSLDPSLVARLHRNPLDAERLHDYLAALDAYAQSSGKWFGRLKGEMLQQAEAAARHFSLTLNARSAGDLREFLFGLQHRLDLAAILQSVTGQALDNPPDDQQILTQFHRNHAAASAMAQERGLTPLGQELLALADDTVSAINKMLGESTAPAAKIMLEYQLPLTPANATRLHGFVRGLEARLRLTRVHEQLTETPATELASDDAILRTFDAHQALFDLLDAVHAAGASPTVAQAMLKALSESSASASVASRLMDCNGRAVALIKLELSLKSAGLFDATWLKEFNTEIRAGGAAAATLSALAQRLGALEGILRVRDGLSQLPAALGMCASELLNSGASAPAGYSAIRRAVLSNAIARRLREDPQLQSVDGISFKTTFERYRELIVQKQQHVRDLIGHFWTQRQKTRLLATDGTRLNGLGADLRRRITGRGERAMRLRQVIGHGAGAEGGDPLFELRPVWMASPETVAQLFPREPIFDVVVFDEASQCRLEDALPVLTRAKRVVIAGDPQQLPPTRFFESTVASSDDEEVESEQELFEAHQAEVEDLLGAALGLDIQQCYLDVHYRSRNAALIGFSNDHFYHSRLQPIPDHPRNLRPHAPLTLYRIDGTYEKRKNEKEAEAVCQIVRQLLTRSQPPSIGIACFNLQQRDLIMEKLENQAEQDGDFATRLGQARARRGHGLSQGLFVKNLENVQGDERDHLIISTTFGLDPNGHFRRNFGPLGAPGGGRRLNVLITRARHEIHVVTSIPRAAYASLPPIPDGKQPTGVWLLFAYLSYVEQLAADHALAYRIIQSSGAAQRATVESRKSLTPSNFARALAGRLAVQHNVGSTVHWGSEGFCVDLALHHPAKAEDVTLGVLCDMTRYSSSQDAVEWEVFRSIILEQQGWKLHRVWTPHFFRDTSGCMQRVVEEAQSMVQSEKHAATPISFQNPSGPAIRESIAKIAAETIPELQLNRDAA